MKHELNGRTVLVAGMGKSGLAAIDLLRQHGAQVISRRTTSRVQNVPVALLPQTEETFTRPDLIVLSPGVPVDIAPVEAARARRAFRSSVKWNSPELFPEGADLRHHGLERQDHHDGADRPSSERMRNCLPGRGQYRDTANGYGRDIARRPVERPGAVELPTRNHRRVPRQHRQFAQTSRPTILTVIIRSRTTRMPRLVCSRRQTAIDHAV